MKTGNYIIESIESIVTSLQVNGIPNFLYGHRKEINNRLLEQNTITTKKEIRYPCIALRLDIPEFIKDGMIEVKLNIAILSYTDKGYYAPERIENVYKPVLYPLYNSFMEALVNSGLFTWDHKLDGTMPEHTKVDRMYWGIAQGEGNVSNIFSDPLDAIELIDLKLKTRINC
jgi:hypothetical protein